MQNIIDLQVVFSWNINSSRNYSLVIERERKKERKKEREFYLKNQFKID
jgi:hypothetical protein